MPTLTLPGTDSPSITSYVTPGGAYYLYSAFTAPLGRTMANGSRNIYAQSLDLYVAGRSGTVSIQAYYASAARGSYVSCAAQGTPTKKSFGVGVQTAGGSSINYGIYWGGGGVNFRRGGSTSGQTNSSGSSSWDTSLSGTLTYAEAPAAPTPIAVDSATPTSLQARFSGNSDGGSAITGWTLQYATNSSFTQNLKSVSSSGTTTVTGLTPDTTYYFRAAGRNVVTDNQGTTGPWSTTFSGTTLASTPSPPVLTLTNVSATQVKLNWTAPSDGGSAITGYDINEVFGGGSGIVATTGAGTRTWTSGSLASGTHKFKVRAKNANGDGSWSNEVSNRITRTGYPKVRLSGGWTGKPVKVYLSGSWAVKPVKVYKGGQWIALL